MALQVRFDALQTQQIHAGEDAAAIWNEYDGKVPEIVVWLVARCNVEIF